ncbi:hypothetical protein ACFL13_03245, partial [Patescibacteria group bacterium]
METTTITNNQEKPIETPPAVDIEQSVDAPKPPSKFALNKGLIAGVIFGVIVIAGAGFGYSSLKDAHKSEISSLMETHEQEKVKLQEQIDTLTAEAELLKNPPEPLYCDGGTTLDSEDFGFKVCVPEGWGEDAETSENVLVSYTLPIGP